MKTWKIAFATAVLAAGLVPSAHADEFTKLTLLTFSGPVDVPGITLPAGTYRFELADPTTSRRVIRVSDKDGSKTYGMFFSIPNQRMTPADKPVVMFRESAAGAPPAVQVWFYPGESYGYEFAYPHDQALKIAKATHQSVLAYKDDAKSSSSDSDRMASMTKSDVGRIDENDRPVSNDEALKESSERRTPVATPAASAAPAPAAVGTSGTNGSTAGSTNRNTTTSNTTTSSTNRSSSAAAGRTPMTNASGSSATAQDTASAKPARKHLPRTASSLPLLMIFSGLSLAAAFGLRLARRDATSLN
jgi:hypothetical protein